MNITLTDVLSRVNQGQSNQVGAAGSVASASVVAKQLHASAILNSLVSGQTIGGQIRSMQGGQILLDIGNGVEINARMDGDIKTSVGRHMLFEVKANSDDKLTLSPLYTNLSAGKSAAMSALHAAGMPLTAENAAMVKSMMEEGLPIDKTSLWQMGKAAADFPQASADTVVRLTAMGMEINETNVMQYEATNNMQHQLLHTMEDITNALPKTLSLFAKEGQPLAGLQFMKDMIEVLQKGQGAEEAANQTGNVLTGEALEGEAITGETIKGEVKGEAVKGEVVTGEALKDGNFKEGAITEGSLKEGGVKEEAPVKMLLKELDSLMQEISGEKGGISTKGKESAQDSIVAMPQKEAMDKAQQAVDKDGAIVLKDGAKLLEQERTVLPEKLAHRLESLQKDFVQQVKNLLEEEWTIKPEHFSDKEEVKAFYQKIKNQSGQLQELFSAAGKADTAAGQAAGQMHQNLEFMQNLNQMFPYLQIPLKASLENAHGELYVYQKKKGKVSEDGSCSALLHLEMQHLGNLDIYVKLKDANVSTQFTLANEDVLDFLAQHITILNERLEKKGYHMQAEMKYKNNEQEENVMSRIRGIEERDTVVSYTAFDVRA